MAVLRSNSQGAALDTQVDTTAGGSFLVSAPGLANFPGLVSNGVDYYWGVLDPDGSYGAPEIVQVTAHPGSALATPTGLTITVTGTAGTTTYGYRVSAINGLGETLACAEVTITTGNATLSGTNYNALAWTAVTGASGYKVYGRTAAGELYMATVTTNSYNDTGAVTPAGALPAASTALATMATILGAQQGSTGRVHLVGEIFVPSTVTAGDFNAGAWTTYTPTIGGTGWAIGNGTVTGRYRLIDVKTLALKIEMSLGSTTTVGTGGLTIGMPSGILLGANCWVGGRYYHGSFSLCEMEGGSGGSAFTVYQVSGTGSSVLQIVNTSSSLVPANGDTYIWEGTVEIQ